MRRLPAIALLWFLGGAAHAQDAQARNVILIVTDGLRWEEVFTAPTVTSSQIAATIARLLGENWLARRPDAGTPLP